MAADRSAVLCRFGEMNGSFGALMKQGSSSTNLQGLRDPGSGSMGYGLQVVSACPEASVPAALCHFEGHAWYVCLTKPRQEAYAAAKLGEQGYQVYLPLLDSWARRAGRWCKKQSVMFPRYAFVRPSAPGQSISPVRSTPGVTTLVKFGPVLASLPESKLHALQALVHQRAQALPGKPLAAGQQVVFAAGPFKGMAGLVSSVADERVSVLMSLLGQHHHLQTTANDLAAA